jgi:serine/threonine-protein kinase PpkA
MNASPTTSIAASRQAHAAGYRLESLLGRGRGTAVYLAQEPLRGRHVALKLAEGGPGFDREFEIATTLAHPGVIQMVHHGDAGGEHFLAMEYAGGGHVGRLPRPVAPERAVSLLRQAASALAGMHAQGWVHRDVKPANLLLREDGSLALGDFGLACRQGAQNDLPAGTVIGTPLYAAPEQSQGAPADPAADVYSLGVVFYELLCGAPPFPGRTLTELLGQHLLAPVPRLPQQLCRWQPLLDAMLAKDARQRLPDGQAVLAESQAPT